MSVHTGAGRRFDSRTGLSVVLRPSRAVAGRIRTGDVVEVRMGDGRIVAGRAAWIEPGTLRVTLPEGAK